MRKARPKGNALAALPAAPYNPRKISAEALKGLKASLVTFGDLSGVVFNRRTKHLVCGHQRSASLGDLDLSAIAWGEPYRVTLGEEGKRFASDERHGVVSLPDGARLNVREVNWPLPFEKAANVAANNPHIGGEWAEGAETIFKEISEEFPDLYASLRIDEIRLERLDPEDYSELDAENRRLAGKEDATLFLIVPMKHKAAVTSWLANGEQATQTGLGRGVMKRMKLKA